MSEDRRIRINVEGSSFIHFRILPLTAVSINESINFFLDEEMPTSRCETLYPAMFCKCGVYVIFWDEDRNVYNKV